jgi:hypothetical protein
MKKKKEELADYEKSAIAQLYRITFGRERYGYVGFRKRERQKQYL